MKRGRRVLFALLLYVTLDLSLPAMPGAFVFEPAEAVESAQMHRGRTGADVVPLPAPVASSLLVGTAPLLVVKGSRPARTTGPAVYAVVSRLPRAALVPAPASEDLQ